MKLSANPILIFVSVLLTIIFSLAYYFDPNSELIFFYISALFVCIVVDKKALIFTGSIKDYSKILLLFCIFTPLIHLAFTALRESGYLEKVADKEFDPFNVADSVCTIFFIPIIEEFLCRHLLFKYLRSLPKTLIILFSATLFFSLHSGPFYSLFFSGLFFAFLYSKFNSLVPCIVLHSSHNAASILYATFEPSDFDFFNASDFIQYWSFYSGVQLLGLGGVILYSYYCLRVIGLHGYESSSVIENSVDNSKY
ncbi:MAG: CPBP family intramembrane metalloprotease [Proteobacteria bacterium]|nr:MAG: CPBP family intramembrane metalloprotease [Pseudomonadota bacterium]